MLEDLHQFQTLENQNLIATAITLSPKKSVQKMSDEQGLSVTLTGRILRQLGFKPYRQAKIHQIVEDDIGRRLQFCELFKSQ